MRRQSSSRAEAKRVAQTPCLSPKARGSGYGSQGGLPCASSTRESGERGRGRVALRMQSAPSSMPSSKLMSMSCAPSSTCQRSREKGVKKERGREKAVHAYSSPRVCNRVCVPRARESEEPSQATTVQSCGHRSHR